MALAVTAIILNTAGLPITLNTDDDHLTAHASGIVYNDGTDTNYYFQPWSRVIRIVSSPTSIGIP